MKIQSVGIIGAGHSAHALCAYLSQQGHSVSLYARNPEKIAHLKKRKTVIAEGEIEGEFPLAIVTSDLQELCLHTTVIFIATLTTAYPDVATQIAPFLQGHHQIILFSSKLCGSLEFHQVLKANGKGDIPILETDALFACRFREEKIWLRGIKKWNLFSAPTKSQSKIFGPTIKNFFPHLEEATNLIQRGLTDFGAIAHPVITMVNLNKIDRKEHFLFYYEGLSEKTIVLLEELEREFQKLAQAYGSSLISIQELLNRYYGCEPQGALKAMQTVPNYRHSIAPTTLDRRFFHEDVACTLVPAQAFAVKAKLKTPLLDSLITFSSLISGKNYQNTGRNLETLGLLSMNRNEILAWMNQ